MEWPRELFEFLRGYYYDHDVEIEDSHNEGAVEDEGTGPTWLSPGDTTVPCLDLRAIKVVLDILTVPWKISI